MASRGRKPNVTPTVQWSIMVPIDLAFRVETALLDPVTSKATYASRSKLIQSLLFEWLQKGQAAVDTSQGNALLSRDDSAIPPAQLKEPTP